MLDRNAKVANATRPEAMLIGSAIERRLVMGEVVLGWLEIIHPRCGVKPLGFMFPKII